MDEQKLQKLEAQGEIQSALKKFRGEWYEAPPKGGVRFTEYYKLNRLQIDTGVVALVLALDLSGGSVGDVDLYRLVRNYLWHPEATVEINKVVDRFEGSSSTAANQSTFVPPSMSAGGLQS